MKKLIIIGHSNIGRTILNSKELKCDFTRCSTVFMDKQTQYFKDLTNTCKETEKATDLVVESSDIFRLNEKTFNLKTIGSKYHK